MAQWRRLALLVALAGCPLADGFAARPAPRLVLGRARIAARRARVEALDINAGIQAFRDSWAMAGEAVLWRTVAFVGANLIATAAWKGISGVLEETKPAVIERSPDDLRDELGRLAAERAQRVPAQQWLKLVPCLLIDLGGDASYLLPLLGEVGDLTWAPTSALLLKQLFGSNTVAGLDLAKELLFFDFIPVATLAWALETFAPESPAAKALGLGHRP